MNIIVKGINHPITPELKEYVESKADKVTELGVSDNAKFEVKVTEKDKKAFDDRLTVDIFVTDRGPVIKAEAHSANDIGGFDIAFNKILEQLRRNHDKRTHISKKGHRRPESLAEATANYEDPQLDDTQNTLIDSAQSVEKN
ncbi:MAG: HPF/RaiA family ribosome-associated protein [Micrococcaceae bacterium]